jgi:hypothetical protein
MHVLQKRKKDLVCVLSPHVGIVIEKEKSNMCFANEMQVLHTLYLSNCKNGYCIFGISGFLAFMEVLWVHFLKHVY